MTSLRRRLSGALLRGLTRAPVRLPEERLLGRLSRLLDPDGAAVIDRTQDATLVTFRRRAVLFYALRDTLAREVPGGVAEIGVHRGGTAGLLAAVLLDAGLARPLHLYDAWGALPSPTEADGRQAESYRHENIPEKLADLAEDPPRPVAEHTVHAVVGYPRESTTYHQGWYEETLRRRRRGISPSPTSTATITTRCGGRSRSSPRRPRQARRRSATTTGHGMVPRKRYASSWPSAAAS